MTLTGLKERCGGQVKVSFIFILPDFVFKQYRLLSLFYFLILLTILFLILHPHVIYFFLPFFCFYRIS